MDGAWALYEAWVKLQLGEVDTALVYCYGKSSPGDRRGADPPARPVLRRAAVARRHQPRRPAGPGRCSTPARPPRRTWPRSPPAAAATPGRTRTPSWRGTARSRTTSPSRCWSPRCASTTARRSPTARAAVVLAAGDVARELCERPAWIRGIDHRIEPMALGLRDLTTSASTRIAGEKAGVATATVDVAELHAPFTHQELILREALGLGDDVERQPVGRCAGRQPDDGRRPHPHRRGGPADHRRRRRPGVAHATSGPCLQQNLVTRPGRGGLMGKERVAVVGIGQTKHQATRGDVSMAGLVREAAPPRPRRRRDDAGPTSTPSSSARRPTSSRA